jgi:RimJ/RimL family protein N-acetyltransferase
VEYHEQQLAEWSPNKWALELLVWASGKLVGSQAVMSTEFGRERRVATGSWVGPAHQRRGIGTEMRAAVLDFAFRGLGAVEAESSWLEGNVASKRVSEKLGYVERGVGEKSPRGVPVREYGVAIERRAWICSVPVTIEGLELCLPLFGVT